MEYVMSFLIGLNDSFAQIRGQLLLLDPLPPINKVFSLVSQEERKWTVSSSSNLGVMDSINNMAFMVSNDGSKSADVSVNNPTRNRFPKKERPFCTHCNYHGHTVEKCYKLHGYPPGYKQEQKTQAKAIKSLLKLIMLIN